MATFREETEMTALWVPKVTKNKVRNIAKGTTDPGVDCFDQ